jgi:hypothetical protein
VTALMAAMNQVRTVETRASSLMIGFIETIFELLMAFDSLCSRCTGPDHPCTTVAPVGVR